MQRDQTAPDSTYRDLVAEAMCGMDGWQTTHPNATFAELEQEVEVHLAVVRARMLEVAATSGPPADPLSRACAWCGGALQARGQHRRQVRVRGNHPVTLTRSYCACGTCGRGLFPPG